MAPFASAQPIASSCFFPHMVLSNIHTHTHTYHPFGLTGLLSPPAATVPVCLHLPFLCKPQKEGRQRSGLALSLCAGFIESQWCPGVRVKPRRLRTGTYIKTEHPQSKALPLPPDPSVYLHTFLRWKWIGSCVYETFCSLYLSATNAGGWKKTGKKGFLLWNGCIL